MQARTLRAGWPLILLFVSTGCSNVLVVPVAVDTRSVEGRAAVFECCRSAGLRPHEEIDLKMDAIRGGYGQRIRSDPELLEIYSDEVSEVRIYARTGSYELELESSASAEDLADEIDQCVRRNVPETR